VNIKKSVAIALAHKEKGGPWLRNKLGVTRHTYHARLMSKNPTSVNIEAFAKAFDMKVSEFVALGEE